MLPEMVLRNKCVVNVDANLLFRALTIKQKFYKYLRLMAGTWVNEKNADFHSPHQDKYKQCTGAPVQ